MIHTAFFTGQSDHLGNIEAEISFSSYSNYWNFPSLYYSKVFDDDDKPSLLQLIFIDTGVGLLQHKYVCFN
jgi:hypothetical protein